MEKRVQALVTLSRRAVMGFAFELGVRVRFDTLDYKSSAGVEPVQEQ